MTKKILVLKSDLNDLSQSFIDLVHKYDREAVFLEQETQEEFIKHFENNDVDIVVNTWPFARQMGGYTNEMIRKIGASGVRAVCHEGAGYEVVGDIDEWAKTSVEVSNCPNAPGPDTADTAVFLTLGAIRNYSSFLFSLHEGNWRGDYKALGLSPCDVRVGILGMGNIGRLIRDRLAGFQFKEIQYYQRHQLPPDEEKGAKFLPDLDEFLSTSDAIVIVVPHNKSTHHLISREKLFNVIKPGASIINVARGPIIDESALLEALESNRIANVGLDVFEREPEIDPKLIANPRALLLPHIGTHTTAAIRKFGQEIVSNVKSVLETGHVISLVPELCK